jgi:soluble lytic murein transglycosylase-like protein
VDVIAPSRLPELRKDFASAANALARGDSSAAAAASRLDGTPLGLSGLSPWLALSSGLGTKTTTVEQLLAFASMQDEVLAREALGDAARLARTSTEKRAVRAALAARPAPHPDQARAVIAYATAFARAEETPAAARARLVTLAAAWPDAPERAADLFDEVDRASFEAAARAAPPRVRAARAKAVAPRDPKIAAALLKSLGAVPEADVRTLAAEAWLAAGGPKDARRLLSLPPPPGLSAADARHRDALAWIADVRTLVPPPPRGPRRRRARSPAGKPKPAPALTAAQRATADAQLAALGPLLERGISEEDRRQMLESGVRLARRAGRLDEVRRLVPQLLELDPSSDAGAAEAFRDAFDVFLAGDFESAAHLFEEQVGLYREVTARRRATYWAARAKERLGDAPSARALYANLVPGTAPDLYARWAAAALGMTLALPAPQPSQDADAESEIPLSPSREYLLCGFPDLAGDAAELEGTLDAVFSARVAAGTGDYRRAAVLLKRRYPELGTPEEGAVPPEVRRAFYPVAHADVVSLEARRAGVPASLLYGVIRQESVFTTDVRSRAGALGLMQVMPATGRNVFRHENGSKGRPDLRDPGENVRLGTAYLRDLLAQFGGDTAAAVAAYNAGPGRVRAWKKAAGALPQDEFLESIPIAETRAYVKRVLYFQSAYAALYGLPLDAPASQFDAAVAPSP